MMRIRIKYIFVMLLSLLLQSCSNPKPQKKDFVGIWKSDDGAVIELKEDGSYVAKQINYYHIYSDKEFNNRRFDFIGNWKIVERGNNRKVLELNSNSTYSDYGISRTYTENGKIFSHKIGISFEISGQGILENKPPWNLFVWIGDPDEMNKYKFVKQ